MRAFAPLPPIAFLLLLAFVPIPGVAQEPDTVHLAMIVDEVPPDFVPLFDQMVNEIRAVVGADGIVSLSPENMRVTDREAAEAGAIYEDLLDGPVDVILAFGPASAEAMSARDGYPKPTILFGAINQDLVPIDESRVTSGIDNFTYVVDARSYIRDLQTFKELYDV